MVRRHVEWIVVIAMVLTAAGSCSLEPSSNSARYHKHPSSIKLLIQPVSSCTCSCVISQLHHLPSRPILSPQLSDAHAGSSSGSRQLHRRSGLTTALLVRLDWTGASWRPSAGGRAGSPALACSTTVWAGQPSRRLPSGWPPFCDDSR